MRKIANNKRAKKIIYESIDKMGLNLKGLVVLTEAASGPFIVTPIIAALAGAEIVYAMAKDSKYGSFEEIKEYLYDFMEFCEIDKQRIVIINSIDEVKHKIDIVTNLGFVRPINQNIINKMSEFSAIPLMWETWEVREEDIDFELCKKKNIPILGTNERKKELQIFKYVGLTVAKLLFEKEIEIFDSKILLVSSGVYLNEISILLRRMGAEVKILSIDSDIISNEIIEFVKYADAIVVAEQTSKKVIIGKNQGIKIENIKSGIPIIHIAGNMEYDELKINNIEKYPEKEVESGYMTVTTDYVGLKPVVDLHTGGLKVGQALVEGMIKFNGNIEKAKKFALKTSPGMDF